MTTQIAFGVSPGEDHSLVWSQHAGHVAFTLLRERQRETGKQENNAVNAGAQSTPGPA